MALCYVVFLWGKCGCLDYKYSKINKLIDLVGRHRFRQTHRQIEGLVSGKRRALRLPPLQRRHRKLHFERAAEGGLRRVADTFRDI